LCQELLDRRALGELREQFDKLRVLGIGPKLRKALLQICG
jgi:hypothetical protein